MAASDLASVTYARSERTRKRAGIHRPPGDPSVPSFPNPAFEPLPPPGRTPVRSTRARRGTGAPVPGHSPWPLILRALEIHRSALLAAPDAMGVGAGLRRRGGCVGAEPCVTVFVRRKRSPAALRRAGARPLPERLEVPGRGSVPMDVVEAGSLRRNLACGARVGSGALERGGRWGTLGMVARELGSGRAVAITAMHLTGRDSHPPGDPLAFAAVDRMGEEPVLLGTLLGGTLRGVDAAKISIDAPARVSDFLPGVGFLGRPRALTHRDVRSPVHLYGARSRYQAGFVTGLGADFPGEGLAGAFLVAMRCGRGDSGAVCCDLDGSVLGLHVGSLRAAPETQVFCPIVKVLEALGCEW